MTSVLQEIERTLEMCNIRITSFVTNIESKRVLKVVKQLVQGVDSPDVLVECIHGRIINRHGKKIRQSLEGFIGEHHRFTLELLLSEYELLLHHSDRCEEEMYKLCSEQYHQELELL